MLSDEEKKAIDNMKSLLLYSKEHEYFSPFQEQEIDDMNIVLNLIEKQSKEIEELKEENKTLKNLQNDTNRLYTEMIERKNYFERELQKLEDKIKAKIEELDKMKSNGKYTVLFNSDNVMEVVKAVLQSLLEKE